MSALKAALLGRLLPHSISPEVHKAIFNILQPKYSTRFDSIEYSKIECESEEVFRQEVVNCRERGFVGLNVTFPYKNVAARMEGDIATVVRRIHSANTIACSEPLRVISTDGNGFLFALKRSLPNLPHAKFDLVILGAGGAARAVLDVLNKFSWRRQIIAARSAEAARRAAEPYGGVLPILLGEYRRDAAAQFIVNATPVGQRTNEALLTEFEWEPHDIASDLVYNPLRTRFLDRAAQAGARILDGLGMLIEQAALSQFFWMTSEVSTRSVLSHEEFYLLHASLLPLLTPQWDAFAT